jgi:group I intron endonuclease
MFVYLLYCRVSRKGYVGQTTQTLKRRWQKHCADAQTGSEYLIHRAIRKYGEDAFELSVLAEADNLPALDQIEIEQIEKQGTLAPNGYNIKEGGHHPDFSDETRKKISNAIKGEKNHNYGKKFSDETRAKISATRTGKKYPRTVEVF